MCFGTIAWTSADMRMPVMKGLEATRHIRAMDGGQKVKIVSVTASASERDRADVLAAGLDDFIRGPYPATEIYNCIARHLDVRHVSAPEASRPSAAAVSLDAVARLADDLRNDLRNALVTLNVNTISDVIRRVSTVILRWVPC